MSGQDDLSDDARDLLALLTAGGSFTGPEASYALWGPVRGGSVRIRAACRELRLVGWPIVSDPTGIWMDTDPASVAQCAQALRRRAINQLLTARALRRTAARMAQPLVLWRETA